MFSDMTDFPSYSHDYHLLNKSLSVKHLYLGVTEFWHYWHLRQGALKSSFSIFDFQYTYIGLLRLQNIVNVYTSARKRNNSV